MDHADLPPFELARQIRNYAAALAAPIPCHRSAALDRGQFRKDAGRLQDIRRRLTAPLHLAEAYAFGLVQMLRNLAQARAQRHPVALDIDAHAARLLPDTAAAVWFAQLQAGSLRCTFEPPPGTPPCTADATVAVSTEPDNPDGHIDLSCLPHLTHFITPGASHSCPVGPKRPNLRHYARSLQAAQRHLLHDPNPAPSTHSEIRYLKGHLRRRLRPC